MAIQPAEAHTVDRRCPQKANARRWVLIGNAKDEEPVSIRPFDTITFSPGDLRP